MAVKGGILLAAERPTQHALLDKEHEYETNISREKIIMINDHLAVAVAGLTSDANTLVDFARMHSLRHTLAYSEPIPVESLVNEIADVKQGYTQVGSLRPFGVSFLYAGYDPIHGLQLYHSEPCGRYNAWKAYAIGNHADNAQNMLKAEWKENMTPHEGMLLAAKILAKCDDSHASVEKIEFALMGKTRGSPPHLHIHKEEEVKVVVDEANKIREDEEKQKEKEKKEKLGGN
eukprot:TRINITY_DN4598_c2_g1_i2.p1 TRINITY_DN4598_c2_g1~~TRINITY_DN4598_c2_g1_i2.p1  ORF type:complete len:232 (+),score=46.33 TRINITY_DN4598_c2_g1_i2:212-907(+)